MGTPNRSRIPADKAPRSNASDRKASHQRPPVFVFGSNLAGRHGKGAALEAIRKHGAIYGKGEGRQGQSYAIPTKTETLAVRPLEEIAKSAKTFVEYARRHPEETFFLTAIGCGLAGYKPEQIAPMFIDAPNNVTIPSSFLPWMKKP